MESFNYRSETALLDARTGAGEQRVGFGLGGPYTDPRYLLALLGLTGAYWFLASNGLQWANVIGAGSPIWPAGGVALAGLALGGVRLWPAIFIGRILAAITIGSSNSIPVVLGIAAGNALAAALPVLMLRSGRVDLRLITMPDVLWIVGASALSALIAASIGTATLALGGALPPHGALTTWTDWIYGNFAGMVAIAPFILAWACSGFRDLDGRSAAHLALALAIVVVFGWLIFFADGRLVLWRTWHLFPALVWAALAFQVRGAATALLITALMAVWGATEGAGPFVLLQNSGQSAEVMVQQFVGLTGATILLLAAAADERRGKEALRESTEELQRQKSELETLYREAPVGLALLGPGFRFLRVNEAMAEIYGVAVDEALGRTLREVLPEFAPRLEPLCGQVFAIGQPIVGSEISVTAPDRVRHLLISCYPVSADGTTEAVSCLMQEITERKEAEERERLLAREVDHRAKNLLAVIQGMVQLTRAEDMPTFISAVTGRIQALGRAHSLLAASRWEGVDLRQLAAEELEPFLHGNRSRVRISGPALHLRPAAAQSIALVLHELATNAAKYGALSTKEGRIELVWAVAAGENGRLSLRWRERDGPPVVVPTRRGFGSTVIRSSVERQLKGTVIFDWRPEGLVCEMTVPADQLVAGVLAIDVADGGEAQGRGAPARLADCRVLVLEDEALVAMQIEDTLDAVDCTVIGPAARISEAIDFVHKGRIDVALLDLNVAGERSFPVADLLRAKGIPFAFCTGYEGASELPERFQGTPVVTKPFAAAELINVVDRLATGGEVRRVGRA